MDQTAVRDKICALGMSLFNRGLTHGSSGNISAKLDDGSLICTPTNVSLGSLDPARLAHIDATGRLLSGDPPTKELPLHTAMYETRASDKAIVHLHSTHCVAVSMLEGIDPEDALPPLTAYYLMKVGRTALLPFFVPGSPKISDAIRGLEGRYGAILLANHGPVVCGSVLENAGWAIEELEETARLFLLLQGRRFNALSTSDILNLKNARTKS